MLTDFSINRKQWLNFQNKIRDNQTTCIVKADVKINEKQIHTNNKQKWVTNQQIILCKKCLMKLV